MRRRTWPLSLFFLNIVCITFLFLSQLPPLLYHLLAAFSRLFAVPSHPFTSRMSVCCSPVHRINLHMTPSFFLLTLSLLRRILAPLVLPYTHDHHSHRMLLFFQTCIELDPYLLHEQFSP